MRLNDRLALRTGLIVSTGVLLVFLPFPTIDHDEGFFALQAKHFWTSGHIGFTWTDVFFGRGEIFFPLNSLTPMVNLAPAYMWGSALFWGRLISAACVVTGQFVLLGTVIDRIPSRSVRWLIALSLFWSLPLWLSARMIRPDAEAFLAAAIVLKLAIDRRAYLADLSAGVFAGLAFLAHNIHGFFVVALLAGIIVATAGGHILKRLAAASAGTALVVGGFYLWYGMHAGFGLLIKQVVLFARFAPRDVGDWGFTHHLKAWFTQAIAQSSWIPLLGFAALALTFPLPKGQPRRIVLALKLAMVLELFVWILVYPRKALSPACFLLPVAVATLSLAWQTAPSHTRNRNATIALMALLAANLLVSIRYHARLLNQPRAVESLTPARAALERSGALDSDHPKILSKLWLSFELPRATSNYDVTLFPVMERYGYNGADPVAERLTRMDAVVLEWDGHQFLDAEQRWLADFYRKRGWTEVTVHISRYFTPVDLVIFARPGKGR